MVSRHPDQRLVYLHCSSIFKEANAQIRRLKKVTQVLSERRQSIQILTNEFTLDAIAAVAKQLLDDRIFESLPRAELRFPELFQRSETQEAEREASEAEVARIEAGAAQETVVTSDEEWEDEMLCPKAGHDRELPPAVAFVTIDRAMQNVQSEQG